MPQKITQRGDRRKSRQKVTLDGEEYRAVLTWRQRTRSWYLDLYLADGTPVALGRRFSPGWSPVRGSTSEDLPPGSFVVAGQDGYRRSDLGRDLVLRYYTENEIAGLPQPGDLDDFSVSVV